MKAIDIMPVNLRRSLAQFGRGIALARRRRRIPTALMLERTGLSKRTYYLIERGDPRVALGAYAMALHALGLSAGLTELADPFKDVAGTLLEQERLPKRIHPVKPGSGAL